MGVRSLKSAQMREGYENPMLQNLNFKNLRMDLQVPPTKLDFEPGSSFEKLRGAQKEFEFPKPVMKKDREALPEAEFQVNPAWYRVYSQPKFSFHTPEGSWTSKDANAEMPQKYKLGSPFGSVVNGGLEKMRLPKPEALKSESKEVYNEWSEQDILANQGQVSDKVKQTASDASEIAFQGMNLGGNGYRGLNKGE